MRRNLTILSFLVIAIIAVASVVNADSGLSVGGGVTLTESAAGVSMGSRFDACRKIAERCEDSGRLEFTYRPIAAWFSSTGMMPFLVMSKAPGRPVYRASADFNNVNNIQKVELTPDHGLTAWEATNVALKGYQVEIPYLEPGGYAFEWRVTSRDKHNRLMLIIIPINWTSNRTNSVVQQLMVQSAPAECWDFTDEQWVSMLSPAFQPTTALPDPGYLAKRAAQQQTLNQMTQPATVPVAVAVQSQLEPQPRPRPTKVEAEANVRNDGFVPVAQFEKTKVEEEPVNIEKTLVLSGKSSLRIPITVPYNMGINRGDKFMFTRNGSVVAESRVIELVGNEIRAKVDWGTIRPGDKIIFDMEEGR